jgi:hypothetical protein
MFVRVDAQAVRRDPPDGGNWVASVKTIPVPPAARAPRCWTYQSLPRPSLALYRHIGETTMRLRAVAERKLIGWKSSGVDIRSGIQIVGRTWVPGLGR